MEDSFAVCPCLCGVAEREAFAIFDGHAGRYDFRTCLRTKKN